MHRSIHILEPTETDGDISARDWLRHILVIALSIADGYSLRVTSLCNNCPGAFKRTNVKRYDTYTIKIPLGIIRYKFLDALVMNEPQHTLIVCYALLVR